VLLLAAPASARASAEWQFKPFFGALFAGETTLIDVESAAGNVHPTVGVSTLVIGEIFGVEGDFGISPGFFSAGGTSVVGSTATTLTGNVVVAVPRRLVQYTLRPYVAAGGGLMHAKSELFLNPLPISTTRPAVDVGVGVTGFLTNRLGLSWDVRYFHTVGGGDADRGVSIGPERLTFWRATMAVAIRR
jgi:hypothetical protein